MDDPIKFGILIGVGTAGFLMGGIAVLIGLVRLLSKIKPPKW